MIDELIKSPSNSPAIDGTGGGGHACGVGRIYFDWRGITRWRDRLTKRLEETSCEVVNA